jgi:hypothetical protein
MRARSNSVRDSRKLLTESVLRSAVNLLWWDLMGAVWRSGMEGKVSPVFYMVWSSACWKSSQIDGGGGGVLRSAEYIEFMARRTGGIWDMTDIARAREAT